MTSPLKHPRLVGDVGGTNARFAWVEAPGAGLSDVASYRCADHPSLEAVLCRYLEERRKPLPAWIAIGIANPVVGDQVQMTNHHWSFSVEAMRRSLGVERLLVLNDFAALALSLPVLGPEGVRQVGAGAPAADAPIALVGPGTGLGVSGLLPCGGRRHVPLQGEGGHATLAPLDEREEAVLRVLRRRFGHVSAERAISGPGLVHLYTALCELDGVRAQPLEPAHVTERALQSRDGRCVEALELFCAFLGNVAGNVALTLGARGGVYIAGGIVPRLGEWFARSRFRERFESKGRFRAYLEQIPTYVVCAPTPALLGAARALEELDAV